MVYISNQYKIQKQNQVGQHVTHTDTRRIFCSWRGGGGKPKKAQHGQMITKKSAKSFTLLEYVRQKLPLPPPHMVKKIYEGEKRHQIRRKRPLIWRKKTPTQWIFFSDFASGYASVYSCPPPLLGTPMVVQRGSTWQHV